MKTETPPLERLILRLHNIADKNNDEFRYRIESEPTRHGLRYSFVCEETADGHSFLTGLGLTIEMAIEDAEKGVDAALKTWGYKQ